MKEYWEHASSLKKQAVLCAIGVTVILIVFGALVLLALTDDDGLFIRISVGVGAFLLLWDMFGPKWYEV